MRQVEVKEGASGVRFLNEVVIIPIRVAKEPEPLGLVTSSAKLVERREIKGDPLR